LQKAALGKAKKVEKALADANEEYAQREQAVAERLRTMSAAAKSKHFCLCLLTSAALVFLMTLISFFLFLLCSFDWYIPVIPALRR
jgi:hypothetical protein